MWTSSMHEDSTGTRQTGEGSGGALGMGARPEEAAGLRPDGAGRIRLGHGGSVAGAVTGFGWVRWQAGSAGGPNVVEEVGVLAPGWSRGWRAGLLRGAWAAPPRSARQERSSVGLSVGQWAVAVVVFAAAVTVWGPHLRGSVGLLLPAVLAWLVPLGLWAGARTVTRGRLLVVQGCSPQALALHRVLRRVQEVEESCRSAVSGVGAARAGTDVAGAVAVGRELAWMAALLVRDHVCGARVDEELAQVEETAERLAGAVREAVERQRVRVAAVVPSTAAVSGGVRRRAEALVAALGE